ncbi:Transposase DDE domain group 1 [Anaeromicropila populeti]|uniref:Transposase DDE domain group 1 n=1 Tax=Anaeromicropila populeti TaxID=37658 RepID=A0A1I6HPB0_9FIRM|nr:Transposase DDE domain group 1 [Anaeromicropila populeti]
MHTFIVTNMDMKPSEIILFYCNRGRMENFIKESKNGFDMGTMSSRSMAINSNRMQISVLVYNIFNWFRRLVLPKSMRKFQIDTVRLKLLKIAAKMVILIITGIFYPFLGTVLIISTIIELQI